MSNSKSTEQIVDKVENLTGSSPAGLGDSLGAKGAAETKGIDQTFLDEIRASNASCSGLLRAYTLEGLRQGMENFYDKANIAELLFLQGVIGEAETIRHRGDECFVAEAALIALGIAHA
jgi:hypothetical protein